MDGEMDREKEENLGTTEVPLAGETIEVDPQAEVDQRGTGGDGVKLYLRKTLVQEAEEGETMSREEEEAGEAEAIWVDEGVRGEARVLLERIEREVPADGIGVLLEVGGR